MIKSKTESKDLLRINFFRRLLIDYPENTFIEFFRYFWVGGLAFIVDFGSLYIFTEFFRIYYITSATLSFVLGIMVNYFLSIRWVFQKRSVTNKRSEFSIFAIIGVVGLVLSNFLIWFFTEQAHFYYLISKIVAVVFVYLWNYFARKYTLFR